jgi:hypothetical protein
MSERKLRVFICHASHDKPVVQRLSQRLNSEGWIDSWYYEEKRQLSQEDRIYKIMEWLEGAEVILVCLSSNSQTILGELSQELSDMMNVVDRKFRREPILVIPIRFDNSPIPQRLKKLKSFQIFSDNFDELYEKLLTHLKIRGKKQEAYREIYQKKRIRKVRRTAKVVAFFLKIRDLLEERPALLRTKLRVLVCYPTQDRARAKEIFEKLKFVGWIEPRFGEEKTQTAREWEKIIRRSVRGTDVILLCLSNASILQAGFHQPGFADALNWVMRRDVGKVLIIPVRFDDAIPPLRFQLWRWLDYFSNGGHELLLSCLYAISRKFKVVATSPMMKLNSFQMISPPVPNSHSDLNDDPELYSFIKFSLSASGPPNHIYWIAKYPVTCLQYERFLRAHDYSDDLYWTGFPKYDEYCKYMGEWHRDDLQWIEIKKKSKVQPYHWVDVRFTLVNSNGFIRRVTWYEANAYCRWLTKHWKNLQESINLINTISPNTQLQFRLPLETEWIAGVDLGQTKPPVNYRDGRSPNGVVYVPHNTREWFANYRDESHDFLAMCYGEMYVDKYTAELARLGYRSSSSPHYEEDNFSFRLVAVVAKYDK